MKCARPIVRYHGGKWRLADWIISHFIPHRVYIEPFGGAASVLLKKQRSYAEVYNDLDGEIVNLFSVMRDRGGELKEKILLTPFARSEFLEAWNPSTDPMEQARRTLIRGYMGFGSAAVTKGRSSNNTSRGGLAHTGFRANSNRSGTTPAIDWRNYPKHMDAIIERLRGVVIENKDAKEIMLQHDCDDALHYVDPPYVQSTRDSSGDDYAHEITDQDHIDLAAFLKELKGTVILSGYDSEIYNELYSEWKQVRKNAFADGARSRVEVLWIRGDVRQQAMAI